MSLPNCSACAATCWIATTSCPCSTPPPGWGTWRTCWNGCWPRGLGSLRLLSQSQHHRLECLSGRLRAFSAATLQTGSGEALIEAGTFYLAPVRILGIPMFTVLLTTLAGRHDAARRELLARLVERLGREGIALAASAR
jgi:hypothetical protein